MKNKSEKPKWGWEKIFSTIWQFNIWNIWKSTSNQWGKVKYFKYTNRSVANKMKRCSGNSLAVRWLELRVFTAKGLGFIPGQGTKIPHDFSVARKKAQFHKKQIQIKIKYHVLAIKLVKTKKICIIQYWKRYWEVNTILHTVGMVGRKLVQSFGRPIWNNNSNHIS